MVTLADENILQSPEDLARIKSFCGTRIYNDTRWWEHIAEHEGDITSKERTKRVERKYKRRQEALKDRQANTKELPEKAILYRADHVYFHDEHFLYYCPTAIKWLRKTLHNVYSFTKLDTDYKEWSDYLSKCVMVIPKK